MFTGCYGAVLAFARRRLDPDLAQDVAAETFLTAWRRFDDLTGDPLPWLYRIAGNAIANQRRSLARRRRLDDRARAMTAGVVVPDPADAVSEAGRLSAAFSSLSERDREVLRLTCWEGLDAASAAIVLRCSTAAFKVRLHRARRRLARSIEGQANRRRPGQGRVDPLPSKETLP
jgi:RNA polymerase sigma-70 factor (ECF subfamily)